MRDNEVEVLKDMKGLREIKGLELAALQVSWGWGRFFGCVGCVAAEVLSACVEGSVRNVASPQCK